MCLLALVGALLACTASWGDDASEPATPALEIGGGAAASVPVARILSPQDGQQVPAGQPVDITVATESTATSFALNLDGRVVATRAMPPGQSGPSQAILTWQPPGDGTYSLEVIAYNDDQASAPVTLSLTVSGTATGLSAAGATTCTGRVLVSELNFRSGPSTTASRLGQFGVGEQITVIGRNAASTWYKVQRTSAQQVWTINNAQWIRFEGPCSAVPEME